MLPVEKPLASPYRQPLRRWELIACIGVFFLAAVLRLGAPGITEFKRDEATLSRLALDLAKGEQFPFLGIGSSVGFPNAPINVYLFAIPYAVGNNPVLATLFVGFLNVIAVALLWKMTRRYLGGEAAFLASLFYAVSPWAVIYSRKIWAQDILAPFVLATVFTGILGFLEKKPKRWAQLVHLLLLALTVQIHFGAVTLIPLSLLMMVLGWRRITRSFWIGIGLAGLASLPFLYGLYDADLLSISAVRESLNNAGDKEDSVREISDKAFDYAWFTVAGSDIHSLAGENQFQRYLDRVPSVYRLFDLIPIGTLISAIGLGLLVLRKQYAPNLVIMLLSWLILPIVMFTYSWAEPTPHYMIPMMPVAYMIFGFGIVILYRFIMLIPSIEQYQRPLLYGMAVMVGSIIIFQIWLFGALLQFLDTHDTTGAFGTPLHYLMDIREDVLDNDPKRVIVVSNGDSPAFDNDPAVWDILLDDVEDVSFIEPDYLWLIPDDDALLLATQHIDVVDDWFSKLDSPPTEVFSLRPDEGNYHLWDEVPFRTNDIDEPIQAQFANGVVLEAAWLEDGELWLDWQLPSPQSNILYVVFVHAIDGDERIGQLDLPFLREEYWQENDRVLMRIELNLENTQSIRIGMYRIIGENLYQNSEYLDEQGRYIDQWVTIPVDDLPYVD